ncbi:hypothetical protein MMPV_009534 [Pyropia vietnamensis]
MGLEAMSPSPAPSRAAVKQLADERDAVERELAATIDALLAPGGGGCRGRSLMPMAFRGCVGCLIRPGGLVGVPRAVRWADIDVALVRTRRNRVATLRNDVEALSNTLHQRLQEVLAPPPQPIAPAQPPGGASTSRPAAPSLTTPPPTASSASAASSTVAAATRAPVTAAALPAAGAAERPPLPVPFAQVDAVHADSPAAAAGLAAGDLLVSLGDVSVARLAPAAALAALPAALAAAVKAEQPLPVVVLRPPTGGAGGEGGTAAAGAVASQERPAVVELLLRPGAWGGRGVLGCHVVPVRVLEDGFVPQVATAAARHGRGQ